MKSTKNVWLSALHDFIRSKSGLLVLVLMMVGVGKARGQDASIGETVGVPWVGEAGITMSVAELMALEATYQIPDPPRTTGKPLRISPPRGNLPLNPESPVTATWPALPEGVEPVGLPVYGERAPQILGTSFVGATISDSGFIPPDTMGDVGTSQIMIAINGRVRIFNKSGAVGSLNVSTNTFFNSVRNGSTISDPVVKYDRLTGRWFVIAINVSTPNRIVVAVSGTGTITSTSNFTFFQFQQDLVGTTPNVDTGDFADYCTLGVDANALYIGCRMFAAGGGFYGTTGWVVRKSSITGAGPIVVTAFRGIATTSSGIDAPRGVHNDDPAATQGYFIGQSVSNFGRLVLRRVSNPGGTPTISANINLTVPSTTNPELVPAQGSTTALEAVDDRLFAASIRLNRLTGVRTLWTAHCIEVNASGVASTTGGRNAMRWYQIQNFGATPSLVQSGTWFDNAASTPRYYWMGAINMSGQGHAAIGASFAATDEFIGAATAGRLSGDTLGTLQATAVIINGTAAYNQVAGGRNRWGDYSFTAVDPTDDMTMWTFQEYTSAANTWAVRVVRLIAPPPATPVSCSPSSVAAGTSNVDVTVTGVALLGSGFFDPGSEFPNRIAASVGGSGVTVNSVTFNSATSVTMNVSVAPSATAGSRTVTITNPDGQALASSVGIFEVTSSCSLPVVTTNPVAEIRCTGTSVTFDAAGTGSPAPTFQWRKNTVDISGQTGPTLTIASVTVGDGGSYDCVLTNTCGSVTTTGAQLTVRSAPAITTNPASAALCEGASVSFDAGGTGAPTPTFQWRLNGEDLVGKTTPTLTINSVTGVDGGVYDCVLTNACGSATTSQAVLTVNTAPSIQTEPVSQEVCEGLPVSFSVAATGTPAPGFQWRKNGVDIDGQTSSVLNIAAVSAGDVDSYTCFISNSCGSVTSAPASLTMKTAPQVTLQPVLAALCEGQSLSLSVSYSGTEPVTVQWQRNETDIPGALGAEYTVTGVTEVDAGSYRAVLTNSCGSTTSDGADVSVGTAPIAGGGPNNQTKCTGDMLEFVVTSPNATAYQWRKDGEDISGQTGPSLTITSLGVGDAGVYACLVSNLCGSILLEGTVVVNEPVVITTQPESIDACTGTLVVLSVEATGTSVGYQWYKDGGVVLGENGPAISLDNVSELDAGEYFCRVSNTCTSIDTQTVVVNVGSCCPADFNQDGGIDGSDVIAFFSAFEAGDQSADVNLDGGINGDDVEYFFQVFEAGGC